MDVNLVTSKTRVTPIKGQSVPHLELLGAVILARLMHSVYEALQFHLKDLRLFYWTDSYTGNSIYYRELQKYVIFHIVEAGGFVPVSLIQLIFHLGDVIVRFC